MHDHAVFECSCELPAVHREAIGPSGQVAGAGRGVAVPGADTVAGAGRVDGHFGDLQVGADAQQAGDHEGGDGHQGDSLPDAVVHREWAELDAV